jgi:hypothetical protein
MVPQYLSEDGKEIDDDISVNIMDFSLDKLILSSLLEAGVDDVEITEEVMSIYNYNKEEATQC